VPFQTLVKLSVFLPVGTVMNVSIQPQMLLIQLSNTLWSELDTQDAAALVLTHCQSWLTLSQAGLI
jgi:hypothetical protein